MIVDGPRVASPLHGEWDLPSTGEHSREDSLNTWTFAPDGRFQHMRAYSGRGIPNGPVPSIARVSFPDSARGGRLVNASVCLPAGSNKLPLLIFTHGWRVAAEDYDYLCQQLAVAQSPWVVALIETELEDPTVQPPLLSPLAGDAVFLSQNMLNAQGTLFTDRLNGKVVLGGHSMGGGTSVLAAAGDAKAHALALWAPGLYGNPEVNVTVSGRVTLPSLIMLGNEDCVNVGNVDLRGMDTYKKLGAKKKALVVLKHVNHCFWSTPVKGACKYDICTAVPRLEQQATGLKLFQSFASAALGGSPASWSTFEAELSVGRDSETGVEWEYEATSTGESTVSHITYQFCPPACCSEELAKMGLCSKDIVEKKSYELI